jgi:hypothetical protein
MLSELMVSLAKLELLGVGKLAKRRDPFMAGLKSQAFRREREHGLETSIPTTRPEGGSGSLSGPRHPVSILTSKSYPFIRAPHSRTLTISAHIVPLPAHRGRNAVISAG